MTAHPRGAVLAEVNGIIYDSQGLPQVDVGLHIRLIFLVGRIEVVLVILLWRLDPGAGGGPR